MLTPTTIETYNNLLAKKKPLIEMFFDIGISLAVESPDEPYVGTLMISLATYVDLNEANMHMKQIQDFYNATIETYEALEDEENGLQCDEAINALILLESFEKTRDTLHRTSSKMLDVLIEEFHLQEAISPVSYEEMVEKMYAEFAPHFSTAEEFLKLLNINTMLRKSKHADADDVEEFVYEMYAICQIFNQFRKLRLVLNTPLGTRQESLSEKNSGRNDPCPCGSGKKYKKCCLKN